MPAGSSLATRHSPQAAAALSAAQIAHERHFVRRVRERFGLRCSPGRYRAWCRQVIEVDGHVRPLGTDPRNPARTMWSAKFAGKIMRVVFDAETERLVTCMAFAEEADYTRPHDRKMKLLRLGRMTRRDKR